METTITKQEKAIEQLSHYKRRKQQTKEKLHQPAAVVTSDLERDQPITSTSSAVTTTNETEEKASYLHLLYFQLLQSYYHLKVHRKSMVLMTIR